jgi:hypothetical protein
MKDKSYAKYKKNGKNLLDKMFLKDFFCNRRIVTY